MTGEVYEFESNVIATGSVLVIQMETNDPINLAEIRVFGRNLGSNADEGM